MPLINPTPNCYHRVKPYTFAPSNVSWGQQDRSALVRIKADDDRTHLEMRAGSAASNPYLLGVRRARCRPARRRRPRRSCASSRATTTSEDNPALQKFPQTLDAALDALEADQEMREMLGEEFVRVFAAVKRFELARFHSHVSDWEVKEYLELY